VGAGIGMGFINASYEATGIQSVKEDSMNTVFAWNAGLGYAYVFNENLSVDLAYRFVGLGHNETTIDDVKLGTSPYATVYALLAHLK
jgi:opacity protein-like surface antigen